MMDCEVVMYRGEERIGRGRLTNEHPAASRGLPVVLVDDRPHGAAELAGILLDIRPMGGPDELWDAAAILSFAHPYWRAVDAAQAEALRLARAAGFDAVLVRAG